MHAIGRENNLHEKPVYTSRVESSRASEREMMQAPSPSLSLSFIRCFLSLSLSLARYGYWSRARSRNTSRLKGESRLAERAG